MSVFNIINTKNWICIVMIYTGNSTYYLSQPCRFQLSITSIVSKLTTATDWCIETQMCEDDCRAFLSKEENNLQQVLI